MSKKIKIILLENIDSLGEAGQVVSVSEGYARNFLFSQGKAALATAKEEKLIATNQRQQDKAAQAELSELQAKAQTLDGTELSLTARVKEGDDIYGSITTKQITQALNEQAKLDLKPKAINLSAPLTKIGSTDVTINLSPDIEAVIKVSIIPDPDSETNKTDPDE